MTFWDWADKHWFVLLLIGSGTAGCVNYVVYIIGNTLVAFARRTK